MTFKEDVNKLVMQIQKKRHVLYKNYISLHNTNLYYRILRNWGCLDIPGTVQSQTWKVLCRGVLGGSQESKEEARSVGGGDGLRETHNSSISLEYTSNKNYKSNHIRIKIWSFYTSWNRKWCWDTNELWLRILMAQWYKIKVHCGITLSWVQYCAKNSLIV